MATLLTPLYRSHKIHMTNGLHFNYMSLIAQTMREYAAPQPVYQEALKALEAALEAENEQIGGSRKSEETERLWRAMEACSNLYSHLRMIVRGYAGIAVLKKLGPAQGLKATLEQFPYNGKWKMGQRMGSMTKLLTQLQEEPARTWLQELGLEEAAAEMASHHSKAQRAWLSRNCEAGKRTPDGLRKARLRTDAAYDRCAEVVQALYTTLPDEELRLLIQSWNGQTAHALAETAGRQTARGLTAHGERTATEAAAEAAATEAEGANAE